MSADMDISVIIPAYRAAETIERALTSVAAQTLKPREVVVVDDGSGDGTFEAAQAFQDQMAGIDLKVFQQENQGAGAARNRAIGEASGTWVAFLDADDEWLPEKLAVSMATIEAHDLQLVAHNYVSVVADEQILVDCAQRFDVAADPYRGLYRKGFLATSTVVVRRDAVLSAGGFDESLRTAQDFDLWLKILHNPAATFCVVPDALTRYHITPGSITSLTKRRLDCGLVIARRHAPALSDLLYRITAIHYEAVRAAVARRQPVEALGYLFQLLIRLLAPK